MPHHLDVLQIHPDDNICVATHKLTAGSTIHCHDISFTLDADVALGSKLALTNLQAGDKVIKFGEPIGSLAADVKLGGYIHTHNLHSDYLHTYRRGELIEQSSAK
jgi:(2R)-sulfolactate sulfo-lyase subunit alpha